MVGDGGFYFGNPSSVYAVPSNTSCDPHGALDNSGWSAVKEATLRVYPRARRRRPTSSTRCSRPRSNSPRSAKRPALTARRLPTRRGSGCDPRLPERSARRPLRPDARTHTGAVVEHARTRIFPRSSPRAPACPPDLRRAFCTSARASLAARSSAPSRPGANSACTVTVRAKAVAETPVPTSIDGSCGVSLRRAASGGAAARADAGIRGRVPRAPATAWIFRPGHRVYPYHQGPGIRCLLSEKFASGVRQGAAGAPRRGVVRGDLDPSSRSRPSASPPRLPA